VRVVSGQRSDVFRVRPSCLKKLGGVYALAGSTSRRMLFFSFVMHGTLSCMLVCAQLRRIDITRMAWQASPRSTAHQWPRFYNQRERERERERERHTHTHPHTCSERAHIS
jgi:hypothetical protein